MLEDAEEGGLQYVQNVEQLRVRVLVLSIILMVAMLAVFIFSQYIMWRQRKELQNRSTLFDSCLLYTSLPLLCEIRQDKITYPYHHPFLIMLALHYVRSRM